MEFFDALVRYEVSLWNAVDQALVEAGEIRVGVVHSLRSIASHDGSARVQDLSDDIGITVGAASKQVDRLERDGLVERHPNPANRNSSLISVTRAGAKALTSAEAVVKHVLDETLAGVDVPATTQLLLDLQTLLDRECASRRDRRPQNA